MEDIKNIILNDNVFQRPSAYLAKLVRMFQTPHDILELNTILVAVQDAWNYFPHRSLEGRCPAELLVILDIPDSTPTDQSNDGDIQPDPEKIIEAVLAVLLLGLHNDRRVWKTHDSEALDRLFKKGYITNPARKSMSVELTESGIAEAERAFSKLFIS